MSSIIPSWCACRCEQFSLRAKLQNNPAGDATITISDATLCSGSALSQLTPFDVGLLSAAESDTATVFAEPIVGYTFSKWEYTRPGCSLEYRDENPIVVPIKNRTELTAHYHLGDGTIDYGSCSNNAVPSKLRVTLPSTLDFSWVHTTCNAPTNVGSNWNGRHYVYWHPSETVPEALFDSVDLHTVYTRIAGQTQGYIDVKCVAGGPGFNVYRTSGSYPTCFEVRLHNFWTRTLCIGCQGYNSACLGTFTGDFCNGGSPEYRYYPALRVLFRVRLAHVTNDQDVYALSSGLFCKTLLLGPYKTATQLRNIYLAAGLCGEDDCADYCSPYYFYGRFAPLQVFDGYSGPLPALGLGDIPWPLTGFQNSNSLLRRQGTGPDAAICSPSNPRTLDCCTISDCEIALEQQIFNCPAQVHVLGTRTVLSQHDYPFTVDELTSTMNNQANDCLCDDRDLEGVDNLEYGSSAIYTNTGALPGLGSCYTICTLTSGSRDFNANIENFPLAVRLTLPQEMSLSWYFQDPQWAGRFWYTGNFTYADSQRVYDLTPYCFNATSKFRATTDFPLFHVTGSPHAKSAVVEIPYYAHVVGGGFETRIVVYLYCGIHQPVTTLDIAYPFTAARTVLNFRGYYASGSPQMRTTAQTFTTVKVGPSFAPGNNALTSFIPWEIDNPLEFFPDWNLAGFCLGFVNKVGYTLPQDSITPGEWTAGFPFNACGITFVDKTLFCPSSGACADWTTYMGQLNLSSYCLVEDNSLVSIQVNPLYPWETPAELDPFVANPPMEAFNPRGYYCDDSTTAYQYGCTGTYPPP